MPVENGALEKERSIRISLGNLGLVFSGKERNDKRTLSLLRTYCLSGLSGLSKGKSDCSFQAEMSQSLGG
jgi:hypothetical protein